MRVTNSSFQAGRTRRAGWQVLLVFVAAIGMAVAGHGASTPALAQAPAGAPAAPDAPAVPPVPDAPAAPEVPDHLHEDDGRVTWSQPVVRVGQDFELRAGERVREVVVVMGSATIAGEVDRDVVVVLGSVHLASTAVIRGALVTPVSGVVIEEGAVVGRELVVPMGSITAPPGFRPGGEFVTISPPGLGNAGQAVVPWFTQGLLWGRPLVPSLPWLWAVVAVVVLVYLVLALLFERPVRLCREMVAERPLSAFLVGLLVLVLIGPVSFILAVSIIGIPVIPFLVCGLFIAGLLGKVGVTRWLGSSLVAETEPDSRGQAVRSFFVGTAVILLAYMVPVLGILVWAVGSTFGLGAATLAFSSGLRRENPARERVAPATVPTAPVTGLPAAAWTGEAPMAAPGAAGVEAPSWTPGPDGTEPVVTVPPVATAAAMPVGLPAAGVAGADLVAMPKAPFLDRLAAFALDVLLVSVVANLLDLGSMRAFFTLLLGYHIVFWGLKATTLGGIICNLRVVRTDGTPLTFTDATIRGFSSIFSIVALGIGCLWILFDPENQAWHDRFAGTWVVKVPRNWPV